VVFVCGSFDGFGNWCQQAPRRGDEGTSYANDRPFYPNDRPYYLQEGPAYSSDMQSTEELDHAIALSLVEDHG
jgi:hypothetical protein